MGNAMKKPPLSVFLIVIMVGGLAFAGIAYISSVKASTEVIGIIDSGTIWTKANSPYSLTGPVGVTKGVTLTIEPGATVNLNGFYIQVNGTLRARGSNAEKIHFNGGGDYAEITFTQHSPSWNEQISSGSIIENAVLTSIEIEINHTSPKINNNSLSGGITCRYSSSIISNNNIISTEYVAISLFQSSAIISSNTIYNKRIAIESSSDSSIISNNTIIGGVTGVIAGAYADVTKNTIYGCETGIDAGSFSTVEQNLVINNGQGIVNRGHSTIQNNTIANNTVGIYLYKSSTIVYNNIQDNSEYNIRLAPYARDGNATYNWWGTTDTHAISQSIFDNKNDFNLGTVTFTPFLTSPNPEAPVVTSVPTTTPPPETTPTPSQEPQQAQIEAIVGAAIAVAIIGAGLGLLIYLIKRK
jgi:parallel beta-helix repeat protein